jgi:hypothetical protein
VAECRGLALRGGLGKPFQRALLAIAANATGLFTALSPESRVTQAQMYANRRPFMGTRAIRAVRDCRVPRMVRGMPGNSTQRVLLSPQHDHFVLYVPIFEPPARFKKTEPFLAGSTVTSNH